MLFFLSKNPKCCPNTTLFPNPLFLSIVQYWHNEYKLSVKPSSTWGYVSWPHTKKASCTTQDLKFRVSYSYIPGIKVANRQRGGPGNSANLKWLRSSLYQNAACQKAIPKATNQNAHPTTLHMLPYLPNTGHDHGIQ